ncbi:MAG TPA: hypothetical protein VE377_02075 [Candidatus Dormibacteraeota bacterium]|nr:hypothetical protein [Candidatus Dormibacteraeota bacterium]
MATMTEIPETVDKQIPSHDYHAHAHVLSGRLQRPIEQKIEEQSPVGLHDRRGGHFARFSENVNIEGLISFTKGKTRVSGSRSLKTNGWITLSTSIMEGLNVFEVITADRLVSQVSTEHPYENGHYPHVTFLGTQFTNLRVSGFPVTLKLNFGICGKRPDGDRSYLQDSAFLNTVRKQTEKIANGNGLPKNLKARYDDELATIDMLIRTSGENKPRKDEPKITCSLVESIGEIPIPGVTSYGHVLVIPEFGSVALGEIEVGEKMYKDSEKPSIYFELRGIHMNLGCIGHGTATATTALANGHMHP